MPGDSDLGQRVHSSNDGTDGHVRIKMVGDPAGVGTTAIHHVAVDADKNLHVELHGNRPADNNDVILRLSEDGAAKIDGFYDVSLNTKPSSISLVGLTRDTSPADTHHILRLTAKTGTFDGAGTEPKTDDTRSLDVALHDEAGNAFTQKNPLPVAQSESEGDEVHEQKDAIDLAKDATEVQEYKVVDGKTFRFMKLLADSIGDASYDIEIGDGAASETFARLHRTYSSNGKRGDVELKPPKQVVGTVNETTVRVTRKNLDNNTTDVFSTICGVLLDT